MAKKIYFEKSYKNITCMYYHLNILCIILNLTSKILIKLTKLIINFIRNIQIRYINHGYRINLFVLIQILTYNTYF